MRKTEYFNFGKLLDSGIKAALLFILVGMSGYCILKEGTLVTSSFLTESIVVFIVLSLGLILLAVNIFYLLWQILLAAQYKTYPDVPDDKLPTCAVIVPAFNEGRQVYDALMAVLASDYPVGKLEIITVNDGSTDDTWDWQSKAVRESNGRIQSLNLIHNGGKRNALACGFAKAKSEIVVTLDSDSMVDAKTVRRIVAPFLTDPTIGSVAGNVRVLNKDAGFIPKMLDVSFVFGFEFLRSAQSMVRGVLCTPGALSAYRLNCVLPHVNEWVHEKFMGHKANIGEDRALANLVMRDGYGIVFQQDAVIATQMPTTYSGLCRMLIRWGRGNVRESFTMAIKFAYRKFDWNDGNLLALQVNLAVQIFWMTAPVVFIWFALYCLWAHTIPYIISAGFAIVFWAALPAYIYAKRYSKRESLWSFAYGFFNFFMLCWVAPYCLLTVHKSGWLTREKSKEPVQDRAAVYR